MDSVGGWEAVAGNWLRDLAAAAALLGSTELQVNLSPAFPFYPLVQLQYIFSIRSIF